MWMSTAEVAEVQWDMQHLTSWLQALSNDAASVKKADALWTQLSDPKTRSAHAPDRSYPVRQWLKGILGSVHIHHTHTSTPFGDPAPALSSSQSDVAGGARQEGGERLSQLEHLLRLKLHEHFGDWITPEILQESATSFGVVGFSEEEASQIVYRLGGNGAALVLYKQVFQDQLLPIDSGDTAGTSGAGEAREPGSDETVLWKWHGRLVRAKSYGLPHADGIADQLIDDQSDEVLWHRTGSYCRSEREGAKVRARVFGVSKRVVSHVPYVRA